MFLTSDYVNESANVETVLMYGIIWAKIDQKISLPLTYDNK